MFLQTRGPLPTIRCLKVHRSLQKLCRRRGARSLTRGTLLQARIHRRILTLQVSLQKLTPRNLGSIAIALFEGQPNIMTLPNRICLFLICLQLYRGYLTHDPYLKIGTARRTRGTSRGARGPCGLQSTPSIKRHLFINSDPLNEDEGTAQPRKKQTPMKHIVIRVNITVLI